MTRFSYNKQEWIKFFKLDESTLPADQRIKIKENGKLEMSFTFQEGFKKALYNMKVTVILIIEHLEQSPRIQKKFKKNKYGTNDPIKNLYCRHHNTAKIGKKAQKSLRPEETCCHSYVSKKNHKLKLVWKNHENN